MKRERNKPVHIARARNVRVPVYRYAARIDARGKTLPPRYCVAYRQCAGEPPKRETFVAKKSAIERAEEIAVAIANGQADVLTLTTADRDSYLLARRALEPFGITLHEAIEQFVRARSALGGHTLHEAVEFFVTGKKTAAPIPKLSGREVLDRLIAAISDHPPKTMGEYRYRQGIRNDLARFVAAHPRIETVSAQEIRDYLRGLAVGPRRRDNVRDEIVTLFRFARSKDGGEIFSINSVTEAELVKRIKEPTAITTYSADELKLLLRFVSARWLPWLATAAFSGPRPTEILRLNWSAFKWNEKPEPRLAIPPFVARKTKKPRRAEFGTTLRRWLLEFRGAVGPLYPCAGLKQERKLIDELSQETMRLTGLMRAATGNQAWKWERDALRHSYGSYRYAQVKDFAILASFMGNSVQTIRDRYYDSKSEQEAEEWFSVLPEHAGHVIQGHFKLG